MAERHDTDVLFKGPLTDPSLAASWGPVAGDTGRTLNELCEHLAHRGQGVDAALDLLEADKMVAHRAARPRKAALRKSGRAREIYERGLPSSKNPASKRGAIIETDRLEKTNG